MRKKYTSLLYPAFGGIVFVVIHFLPDACRLLEYKRSLIINGEFWRFYTGHLVHWTDDHLFWDVITFYICGSIVYYFSRWGFWLTLFFAPLIISGYMILFHSGLEQYRGLSGVDLTLYTYASIALLYRGIKTRDRYFEVIAVLAMVFMIGKVIYEFFGHSTIFVNTDNSFQSLPFVHVLGGLFAPILFLIDYFYKYRHEINPENIKQGILE